MKTNWVKLSSGEWINLDMVCSMRRDGNRTTFRTADDINHATTETPEQILKMAGVQLQETRATRTPTVTCPECGDMVSSTALTCHECGNPMTSPK